MGYLIGQDSQAFGDIQSTITMQRWLSYVTLYPTILEKRVPGRLNCYESLMSSVGITKEMPMEIRLLIVPLVIFGLCCSMYYGTMEKPGRGDGDVGSKAFKVFP